MISLFDKVCFSEKIFTIFLADWGCETGFVGVEGADLGFVGEDDDEGISRGLCSGDFDVAS